MKKLLSMKKLIFIATMFLISVSANSQSYKPQEQKQNAEEAQKFIGKWKVLKKNGVTCPKDFNEIWYFFDYTSNGYLGIIDEFGDEKSITGTGMFMFSQTGMGKPEQNIWHYENGNIFAIYTTEIMKVLGANYEFKGKIKLLDPGTLLLNGNVYTNMGEGPKNPAPLEIYLVNIK